MLLQKLPNSKYTKITIKTISDATISFNFVTESLKIEGFKVNDVSFTSIYATAIETSDDYHRTHYNGTRMTYYWLKKVEYKKNINTNHIFTIDLEALNIDDEGCIVNVDYYNYNGKIFETEKQASDYYEKQLFEFKRLEEIEKAEKKIETDNIAEKNIIPISKNSQLKSKFKSVVNKVLNLVDNIVK